MSKIRAIGVNVLVSPIVEETRNKSGLIVTDKDNPYSKGTVYSAGEDTFNLDPGDVVYFYKSGGTEMPFRDENEKKLVNVRDREIVAVEKP